MGGSRTNEKAGGNAGFFVERFLVLRRPRTAAVSKDRHSQPFGKVYPTGKSVPKNSYSPICTKTEAAIFAKLPLTRSGFAISVPLD